MVLDKIFGDCESFDIDHHLSLCFRVAILNDTLRLLFCDTDAAILLQCLSSFSCQHKQYFSMLW